MFSHLLLIACICIVVVLVLYFFYWNRFIAFVIGHAIRIFFWNQEGSSVWVEIGSIHFSLLTGRILLKDVRYHSSNQTIKIVKGQIQWRYWIRKPTSEEEIISVPGEHVKDISRLWSCRIQLSFQGVEWFLYNRTAAYDHILDQLEKMNRPTSRSSSHQRFFSRFSRQDSTSPFYPPSIVRASMQVPDSMKKAMAWFRHQLPTLNPKDLLPLGIDIQTGAIILGNPSTPNLLVAEFQDALGTFGIATSKSRYDLYKQILNLKFQKSLIRLVHNEDYVDPMTTLGAIIHDRVNRDATLRKPPFYQSYRTFFKLWRQIKLYDSITDYFKSQRFNRHSQSLKMSNKVLDEETPIGVDFSTLEYAIERKILETPTLELAYYVDVVGEVPSHISTARYASTEMHDIGNCDTDPEWGIDLVIHGGFLRYGPWADRQRAELQRAFFPPVYADSDVTPILRPRDKRRWTALQIFIELREETTLHIPFREASKDWQWDGVVDVPDRPRTREAASISVVVGDRSSVNYVVPLVVGPTGYESTLEVHLDTVSITSSLNDIRLVSAESCRIRCEFPTPARWNAERTWTITAYLRQPTLFLLRDHINMITDLGKDWVSGPPTDYQKFIPMVYIFKLEMHHFELNLYANDQNIVDRPLIKDENALITLKGSHLRSLATIPSNTFKPESTLIPFDITAPDITVYFSLPRWNTHALHAKKKDINVMKSDYLNISGSYRYFSEVREELVEQLKLQFDARGTVFRFYGWSIRYFMVLRDNYFGSFTHFQTLSEYLEKRQRGVPIGDPIALKYRRGKSNMLQIEVTLRAESSKILLPPSLIGDTTQSVIGVATPAQRENLNSLVLKAPEIQLVLRSHDHYMDMSLNVDTVTGAIQSGQLMLPSSGSDTLSSKEILILDGIDISAHRLFGPQPRTATYLCIWEIALGDIKAFMSASEVKLLGEAVNSFRLNFADVVNAPADEFLPAVEPDVTICKLTIKSLETTVRARHAALLVRVPQGIKFDSNDLGTGQYHRLTSLIVPQISVSLLINASTERDTWLEAAEVTFDIRLDLYASPVGYKNMTSKQIAFVANQDRLTGRAKRIFYQLRRESSDYNALHRNSVYLPQPALPNPVHGTLPVAPELGSVSRQRFSSSKFSYLEDPSDSEGEERVSEVDRDARLARTRTSTPVPERPEDDIAMSSGDESDDADLTEHASAEEDWSDIGDSLNEQPVGSLITFYSPLVRHFVTKWSQVPVNWEGGAFEITREGAPFIRHYSEIANDDNFRNEVPFSIPECIPENEGFSTLRVKFCKTGRIITTPLLLQAALYFEEDIKNIITEPETCIDSLLIDCLANITAKKTSKYFAFQVDLPHATGQHIQHVNFPEDGPRATESTAIPSNLDTTSLLNLSIRELHFSGVLGGKYPAIKASIGQAIGTLEASIDKRTLTSISPDSIFELLISTPAVELARGHLWLKLGDISVKIGNQGPELVTATLTAFLSMGNLCRDFINRLRSYHIEITRRVIHMLLKASEQQGPVIDPLSTIQPSYLVQKGIPHSLRTDLTFRLLYHLRSCVSGMDNPQGIPPYQTVGGVDLHDLSSAIESRLALLDEDAANVDDLTSVDPVFFGQETSPNMKNREQAQGAKSNSSLSIQVMQATATILAPAGRPSSQFTINNLGVDVQSRLLDLIQIIATNPSSASQTSLRSKAAKIVRETVILISLGNMALIVTPHLMHFAQHILRVQRRFISGLNDTFQHGAIREALDKSSDHQPSELWSLKVLSSIQHLHVQAAAENLVLVFGINGMQASSALLVAHNQTIQSMNQEVLFDEIYFQARSPADHAKDSDQDILAALVFKTCRISIVSRPEGGSRRNIKFALVLANLRLEVPRSALRLYRFIGEWRADYLPGIEAAIKTLLSEYKAAPSRPHSPAPSHLSRRNRVLQIHCSVQNFEISLQVMHGTWLSWEIHHTIAYFDSSGALRAGWAHAFGLQIKSMVVNVSSKPIVKDAAPSSRVRLTLPPLALAGHSDGYHIHALILLEFIDLKVKPSHWDTLLSVQQKFGQDFNDLVALIQKSRQKRSLPPENPVLQRQRKKTFAYEAHWKMRGFRIGLEGMSSTAVLECQDINGSVSNAKGWSWDVGVSDLALSLAPRFRKSEGTLFNRNQRSAFVTIDFRINGSDLDLDHEKTLELSVSKMHAVMQPSSIGEFGDFIDNLQAEMLERREERASQMAAFKEKTQSILKTFDVNIGEVSLEHRSWITDLIVNVSIRSIGVAFPLTHNEELVLPISKESSPVRAFLFSIKSIEFGTRRGETGQAVMQRLSFQFVSRFRQSVPDDFTAERHYTRNCLIYPEMRAQLRSSSSESSRQIWVKADVSGFVLDIDSTIPKYIFALIDVYRQGKERVERLSVNVPSTPFSSIPSFEDSKSALLEKRYSAMLTSNVCMNLVFHSGKVRLFSTAASSLFRNSIFSSNRFSDLSDENILGLGAEVFNLPVVSVWGEYRATPATHKSFKVSEKVPSVLMFNSTVHSSSNVLRPTLLPFLTELIGHLESRMRKVTSDHSQSSLAPPFLPSTSLPRPDEGIENSISSMQICFSLQIDQSKLELTCQPDVNVVAGLHWESGGFVINISPGVSEASLFGSVGGLTVGLKHGFLSEDCVRLDARNLTFSVSFKATESEGGAAVNIVSVVLDTEILGGVRFSRLQDVLCFKAVWLDRIPVFNKQSPLETKTPTFDTSTSVPVKDDVSPKRALLTVILVRIREIKLEVDLGQSITKLNLGLRDSVLKAHLTDDLNEVFLFLGDMSLVANGNMSGHARVSSCVFQTIRRSENVIRDDRVTSKMLELRLTSGVLVAALDSDQQQLLHYRAEPLEVEIVDDWSQLHLPADQEFRPLQLSFTVSCPEIIAAATIGAMPKLLSYTNKFKANLDAQRQGAFRESQTFRATRTPKPDNPLSAVAEAMLHSARSRFKEADSALSYTILQHMSLRLDVLRLIVFPRSMRDLEIAHFVGRDVRANLNSQVGSSSTPAKRDIHLSFSSMVISKYTQVTRQASVSVNPLEEQAGPDWPMNLFKDATEAIIVGLPSMKMHMISEESTEETTTILMYDFHSEFVRRAGMKAFEDIYITLNISLYSWLTVLRKNLTREMEQVRATEDWRVSMSTVSTTNTAGSQRKKKVPEPLSLGEGPRSATLPSAGTASLSPFTPPYFRNGMTDQSRTPQTSRESLSSFPSTLSPQVQSASSKDATEETGIPQGLPKRSTLTYKARKRHIERLTMRQLGEATPDVMHPFFMKKAGFNLEDSLPQYVHEYATIPLEEIVEILLKLYSQQLLTTPKKIRDEAEPK